MIKLIASDVDGTLIHNYTQDINSELFELIQKFIDKDVIFFVASGRQHHNLKHIFKPIQDKIGYISDNGGLIFYQNKLVLKATLEKELVSQIVEHILNKDGLEICICCEKYTYLIPKSEKFAEYLSVDIHNAIKVVKDISEVDEDVIKISFYSEVGITKELQDEFLNTYQNKISQSVSASDWYELMPLNTHKGSSIKHLQNILNITPEETVVFGDNFNDREMLQDAKFSYAMTNADDELKQIANYTCSDVFETLTELYNKFYK